MPSVLARALSTSVTSAFVACLLAACTGKTTFVSAPSPDGGDDEDSALACVNVDPSTYDRSCNQDSDCIDISPGDICPGSCGCGGAAVNVDGQARYDAATAGLLTGSCPCFYAGVPTCIAHTCTLCEPGPGGTCPGTSDAGPPPADAAVEAEPDAGECVTIDLSTYDRSCQQTSDCVDITSGTLCSGDCLCGGSAINVDGQARYQQAISGLVPGGCGCPYFGSPTCVLGQCVICGNVNQSPGCPDGG